MTNLAHIVETTLLLLAAYLLGCILGYAARRILHAGRGTRQVTEQMVAAAALPMPAEPRRPRSPAARLAASVEDLPAPVTTRSPVEKPAVATPSDIGSKTLPSPRTGPTAKPRGKSGSSDPKPSTLPAPRDGSPDNLTQIKGIGPKIQASLHAMGIYHLDQIAGWNKANVEWVDTRLAFKGRIRRERWVEQALELTRLRASA